MEQHTTKKLLLVVAVLITIGIITWLIGGRSPQTSTTLSPDAGGREAAAVEGIPPGPPERTPSPEDPAIIYGKVSAYESASGGKHILLNLMIFGEESKEQAEVFFATEQAYDSDTADISAAPEWQTEHLVRRNIAARPPRAGDRVAVLAAISAFQRTALDEPLRLRQEAEKRVIFLPPQ